MSIEESQRAVRELEASMQRDPVAEAASAEFNRTFHKCRAEVTAEQWHMVWNKAVQWAWAHPRSEGDAMAADYERMFHAALAALAEVSEALGIPDEEAATANGNELILERIDQLLRPMAGNYRATTDIRGHTVVEAHLPFINGLNAWVMVADLGKPVPEDEMCAMPDREVLASQIVNALGSEDFPPDPKCTCGSDSPRAFNHAVSCPHSTPWNERVKARTSGVKEVDRG